jgi:chromosomal replication initiator protein
VPEQLEPIWDAIRDELRREAPDFQFHIWLAPLELAGVERATLYVRAPEHIRTWVEERYLPLLRGAASRCFDERAIVEIVGPEWNPPERAGTPPAPDRETTALNPKYTFEQFVIGGGNRFAHAAALAAAEMPAQAYNPLFLHGPPGMGKTHLLHAIGNYVRRYGSGLRVRYATIEEFTSAFVEALREQRTSSFKDSFRSADVLLVDDVQFLSRKERTREEFFHTLNSLLESGRQLVLTSDRPPEELSELEDRLVERFRCGLVVELEPPSRSVRRAILEKRARLDGVDVPDDVLDELARLVASSVRTLEGALIRVVAYASLRGEPPSASHVRHLLRRLGMSASDSACSVPQIIDAAAQEFGLGTDELLARTRARGADEARQLAMYLARELTGQSLPEIGRGMGGRGHTTVLHAVNKVSAAVLTDPSVRDKVDRLRTRLGHPLDRRDN